jgi:hypothetical protein
MSATIDAWRLSLRNPFALACVLSSQINAADARHKEQESKAAATRSVAIEWKALEAARARAPPAGHFKQVIETCEPLDTIFDEIDLLEDEPPHRGVAMRNACFRPFWIPAEEKEWQGLWEKGVFKQWSRKDLLSNDRVFTSRYVYKLKRSAITGEVYRFKARLIVRGCQMEKGVDFDDSFSPTPGLAVGRFMLSLAVANDYELHACDIEQAFLQGDKLPEDKLPSTAGTSTAGTSSNHLPVAPTPITEMSYTKFAALFMVTPLHHALCTRPWTPIL